nr:hypothetical protein [Tanacetum cinerariifolium]
MRNEGICLHCKDDTNPNSLDFSKYSPQPQYKSNIWDEHFSTIPKTKSDELIKSSVENLVPIPSEYKLTSDNERERDVPVNDESSPIFMTFSNPLFDCNDDFTSSDDESLSNKDVWIENFKIYSNSLFDDEEIISNKINPHYFNAKSNLIEFLPNRVTLFDSSPKFDYLEDNDSIPLPKNESSNFDHHDDPSFPRPPPEPPDVEVFFNLEPKSGELIAAVMNNIDRLNEDECFDPVGGEIDVFANIKDDDYSPFIFVIQNFLSYLTYPETDHIILMNSDLEFEEDPQEEFKVDPQEDPEEEPKKDHEEEPKKWALPNNHIMSHSEMEMTVEGDHVQRVTREGTRVENIKLKRELEAAEIRNTLLRMSQERTDIELYRLRAWIYDFYEEMVQARVFGVRPGEAINVTMPPRRLKQRAVERMMQKRVAEAIAEYERNQTNPENARGSGPANAGGVVASDMFGCSRQTFMNCQPHSFNGTKGVVGLTRWFEKMEQVFEIRKIMAAPPSPNHVFNFSVANRMILMISNLEFEEDPQEEFKADPQEDLKEEPKEDLKEEPEVGSPKPPPPKSSESEIEMTDEGDHVQRVAQEETRVENIKLKRGLEATEISKTLLCTGQERTNKELYRLRAWTYDFYEEMVQARVVGVRLGEAIDNHPPRRLKRRAVERMVQIRVAEAIAEYERNRTNPENVRGCGPANAGGVTPEKKKIEHYIQGLPENVKANVTSSKLAILHDAINIARELIEQAIHAKATKIGKVIKGNGKSIRGTTATTITTITIIGSRT